MIRATSDQQRWIFWLVTLQRRERLWIGNRKCGSRNWCVSWWTLTWHCSRARHRENTSASCRNLIATELQCPLSPADFPGAALPRRLCAEDSARDLPHYEWRRISVSHRMSRHQTWNGGGKWRVHNSDRGAGSYDVV